MKGIEISFNLQSPQGKEKEILIDVTSKSDEELLYKFFIGLGGVWTTLREFDKNNSCLWKPQLDGKYIIMVQAKRLSSKKPFDYVTRADYIIGNSEEKLINAVHLNNKKFTLGDKINILIEANRIPLMYKYWLKTQIGWELLKDYCPDNNLTITANNVGEQELLVECKEIDSDNNFDDFAKVNFTISDINKIEIKDFKCISADTLVGNELIFQVECSHDENRMILYKFIKIDSKGIMRCIQDYSTKRIVSYIEKESGDYKILCMAKDMYSNREYDDRAIINFNVKPYELVNIKDFTTDLGSPQICENKILLKVIAEGGRELLYRFKIEGSHGDDSGYIRENSYLWESKKEGTYKLQVMVKDSSFKGEFEAIKELEYEINEKPSAPVRIKGIIVDGEKNHVKNKPINIKVQADGGMELKYSFIVYKDGKEEEKVEYGDCNWVNFTPQHSGEYELEVRVKDKFSTKEYDCHSNLFLNIKDYIPGIIDYVLLNSKEYYMIGDNIGIEVVAENTKKILLKYKLMVNGHLVEETDYIRNRKYTFKPKCSGKYTVEILGKSKECKEGYDSKKQIKILVHDALPVNSTKLNPDKTDIYINEAVTFTVHSEGGKDVCYEFYTMEQGEWRLVQKYSKKNYYGFMPFVPGKYKVLVLSKSQYRQCSYEDYDLFEFEAVSKIKTKNA